MKNVFFIYLAKIGAALFLPAFLTALAVTALNQPFETALILLGICLACFYVFEGFEVLSWSKTSIAQMFARLGHSRGFFQQALTNTSFNLAKLVLMLIFFLLIEREWVLNPFGMIGWAITMLASMISIAFLIKKDLASKDDYSLLRIERIIKNSLAIIVFIFLLSFTHLSFGQGIIWIPVALSVFFSFVLRGFDGIWEQVLDEADESIIKRLRLVVPILLTIVALISYIPGFINELEGIMPVVVGYLIESDPLLPFVLLVIIIIFLIAYYIKKSKREAIKEARRILKLEREHQLRVEKNILELARAEFEMGEKRKAIAKTIDFIKSILENKDISQEELTILALNPEYFTLLQNESNNIEEIIEMVTNIPLQKFITISKVKEQIVWDPSVLDGLLKIYATLYSESYNDSYLHLLIYHVNKLQEFIDIYRSFYGYEKLVERIKEKTNFIK